ncbi:hypothetical protein [Streptomyces sp. TRM68367]|uniref:hypothetical protein n=1 Tax=Streptomyces sp. TRM68367 TaxID=2758415 RepID=UPI00165B4AD0|nr:hypothetical protein [Streptomyces sp. TRM68367]MBC9724075.1 hypothetical protein [Streptomyces sp. TRM68367]
MIPANSAACTSGPTPAPRDAEASGAKDEKEDDGSSPFGTWWYVGVFLVVGIGIGFLLSGRHKGQQP